MTKPIKITERQFKKILPYLDIRKAEKQDYENGTCKITLDADIIKSFK